VSVELVPLSGWRSESNAKATLDKSLGPAMKVAHPGIIRGLGGGHENGQRYLVFERVDGEDLATMQNRMRAAAK
jgi:hypothetical protein